MSYRDSAYSAVCQLVKAMVLQPLPELNGPSDAEVAALEDSVRKLELRLGSAKVVVYHEREPQRVVRTDAYPGSVITEIYDAGVAYCKSVSRAHVYFEALQAHRNPETLTIERKAPGFEELIEGELSELIEVGYFRAAAFWDRVGQLLEFVFFNVRDYRDGFAAAVKRLKTNFDVDNLPYLPLRKSPDWNMLINFEKNEHGTLTSKRNVLAHRRALRGLPESTENGDAKIKFVPFTDHLTVAAKKFGTFAAELEYLRNHSRTIWRGASAAVSVSLWRLERQREDGA